MPSDAGRLIAVCHDIEGGWGHRVEDAVFARRADRLGSRHLEAMLAVEAAAGVHATYHVVARLLPRVRDAIAQGGHCLGLHSYDHRLDRPQVARCRRAAPGITGYRPPQSRLTPELLDGTLVAHGFEWLASAASSLGTARPVFEDGLVRIPIHFDDYALYARGLAYAAWEDGALARIEGQPFTCFSLHDCYAQFWLPHYRVFLARIRGLGQLTTLGELAEDVRRSTAHVVTFEGHGGGAG
jgi:hypothetical protein